MCIRDRRGGVGNLLFKFLRRKANAVGLRQGKAVILHVVAYGALYLFDIVHAARHSAYHVHPENILHAGAGDGAVVLFRHFVPVSYTHLDVYKRQPHSPFKI